MPQYDISTAIARIAFPAGRRTFGRRGPCGSPPLLMGGCGQRPSQAAQPAIVFPQGPHSPDRASVRGLGIAAAPGWDTRVRPSNLTARDSLQGAFTMGVSD